MRGTLKKTKKPPHSGRGELLFLEELAEEIARFLGGGDGGGGAGFAQGREGKAWFHRIGGDSHGAERGGHSGTWNGSCGRRCCGLGQA